MDLEDKAGQDAQNYYPGPHTERANAIGRTSRRTQCTLREYPSRRSCPWVGACLRWASHVLWTKWRSGKLRASMTRLHRRRHPWMQAQGRRRSCRILCTFWPTAPQRRELHEREQRSMLRARAPAGATQ
ncbi:hypothetical protein K437DRAFT_275433 [Tilletiaria anomala UBC 951]|uniref:Uncharacterized protein n=1 Tax=Tilletiaria anomala (strain ATCC 24038 / CBS 436.72 / UBC 951) TaxID=1037660 RepID=A0A066VSJ0_TILAU|nr:uncharacterized protein K437DRAFT_275433 [Tilletiaria anomala UBC 951]KDN41535.1 hypothetical protein K437DRAFT_275433 [Tilletiaria anomala UBC 951]